MTSTYHEATGTTLDFSLESEIDFGDDVDNDGVIVTVLGLDPDSPPPVLESGIPRAGESTLVNLDVGLGAAAVCSPAAGVGALVCGGATAIGGSLFSNAILSTGAGTTTVQCWVLATPVDTSGQVVGEPLITQAAIGIETSEAEMHELITAAFDEAILETVEVKLPNGETVEVTDSDLALRAVLPVNGDTFVVMERVENWGPL